MIKGRRERAWLEVFVLDQARTLALASDRVTHEDFVQRCADAAPRKDKGNNWRWRIVRTIENMDDKGRWPYRIEGDCFVLDG